MPPTLTDYTYAFGETGFILNTDSQSLPFVDVTQVTGLDVAPIRMTTNERQSIDGTFVNANHLSMRTIVITGTLYTTSSDPESVVDLLRAAYAPGNIQPFYFKHPGKPLRFVNAQGGGAQYDVSTDRRLGITNVQLTLLCADPYIYNYPSNAYTVTLSTSPTQFVQNSNPTFESGTTDWVGANGATIAQSNVQRHSGTFSMLMTPNGTTATPQASAEQAVIVSATPGQSFTASAWVNCPAGWATGVEVVLTFQTSAGVFISSDISTLTPLVAGQWTNIQVTASAPATAGRAQIQVQVSGTPSAATLFYWDDCYLYSNTGAQNQSAVVLNYNPTFEVGIHDWTAANSATFVQSATFAHTGGFSMQMTPSGTIANPGSFAGKQAITAGDSVTASAWFFSSSAWASGVQVLINWYSAGGVFLSTTSPAATALSASTWTNSTVTGTAPASAAYAQIIAQAVGTPLASQLFYIDDAYLYADPGLGFPFGFPQGFGIPTTTNIPVQVNHINHGTHDAYPVFTLRGPLTNPTITDTANQVTMQLQITLAATDTLVIDNKNKTIVLNGTQNMRTSYQGRQFFVVPAGQPDNFLLSGTGNGTLTVVLYDTYF